MMSNLCTNGRSVRVRISHSPSFGVAMMIFASLESLGKADELIEALDALEDASETIEDVLED